jgi:hypothetical protein
MSVIRPDDFKAQPYAYLTNQLGHIGLGVLLVFLINRGAFELFGEYPVRLAIWAATLAVYLGVVEILIQGWRGFDTVEDTIFTCVYGAGAPLWAFREIAPGSPMVEANLPALDMFFLAAGAHLMVGVVYRLYNRLAA